MHVCDINQRIQYKALRSAGGLTLAQEGKIHQIMRSGQRCMIDFSVFMIIVYYRTVYIPGMRVPNWRLDNAKSPTAAMLQEKAARTPVLLLYIEYSFLWPQNRPGRSSTTTPPLPPPELAPPEAGGHPTWIASLRG